MAVLVVVTDAQDAGPMVRWGARFALARETSLKVLHVSRGSKAGELVEAMMIAADLCKTEKEQRGVVACVKTMAEAGACKLAKFVNRNAARLGNPANDLR